MIEQLRNEPRLGAAQKQVVTHDKHALMIFDYRCCRHSFIHLRPPNPIYGARVLRRRFGAKYFLADWEKAAIDPVALAASSILAGGALPTLRRTERAARTTLNKARRLVLPTGGFAIRAAMAAGHQPPALRRQPRQQNVRREAEIFEPFDYATCAAGNIIGAKLPADRFDHREVCPCARSGPPDQAAFG
jgi:hypothetical protein